jgi:tetratricopeptide (TPR) repeat protein
MNQKNHTNKEFSKKILAKRMGCEPNQLREKVFEQLDSMGATIEVLEEMIEQHKNIKYDLAKEYNMHPDDTIAAVLFEYTQEYIYNLENKKDIPDNDLFIKMYSHDPDLMVDILTAGASGNDEKVRKLIGDNPDFLNKFLQEKIYADSPSEKYKDKAIDMIDNKKDYLKAIEYIKKGLSFKDPENEPLLFRLYAECYHNLNNNREAIKYLNYAITSQLENNPDDWNQLLDHYFVKHDYFVEMKEFEASLIDLNKVIEILDKLPDNSDTYWSKYLFYHKRAKIYEILGNKELFNIDSQKSQEYYNKDKEDSCLF